MNTPRIVIDTNVLVAALKSNSGTSYRLLRLVDSGSFLSVVSVALALEYEAVASRLTLTPAFTKSDLDNVIDFICTHSLRRKIYFQWRPSLRDPNDDMVLELAVAGNCDRIVTFNIRDFGEAERFGIGVVTPGAFLNELGLLA